MKRRAGQKTAASLIPEQPTLAVLRERAAGCQACDLWERGTQTVFGEGGRHASLMLVGEQPGHEEDLTGQPFVGPAGRLLDECLAEAGIDRGSVYVTNVVKHFKWEPRGKRRIHAKPNLTEITACRPWLDAEIAAVKPQIIVCLGATAAQTLLGRDFRVTRRRGELTETALARYIVATIHPSAILRSPDSDSRRAERARFVEDLKGAAAVVSPPRAHQDLE